MGQALLGYCPPKDSEDLGTNENVSGGSSVCIYWDWDFFFFFAMPHGLWDLSFPTRDWTWALGIELLES